MIPDLEAVLRGVPWICLERHYRDGAASANHASCFMVPDFAAMVAAVRKAVAEQDKALRYSARERVRLGEERDALRADLAQARAEGEELRNYKARVGLRHETCDAEVTRLRTTILRAQRVLIAHDLSRASDTDLALVRGELSAALAPPPTAPTP